MGRVNLKGVDSADPRLTLDDRPDPTWWTEAGEDAAKRLSGQSVLRHAEAVSQRASIETLMEVALANGLPRSRPLKPWEPDKLNPRHLQAILMKAAGVSNKLIAAELGVGEPNISVVVNHPDAQYILARIIGYAAENVVDIEARIQGMAPMVLDRFSDILATSKKEEIVVKLGFGLLDRAGYGEVKKQEAVVKHEFAMPTKQVELLADAIKEAQGIEDAQYVVVASDAIQKENQLPPGGPNPVGSEGGSGQSRLSALLADAGEPPVSSPQHSLRIA